ncbi:hypothetical protein [Amycolatopsis antarctica]|nr:hypothetical protein [Amycolatopsis antarctica]
MPYGKKLLIWVVVRLLLIVLEQALPAPLNVPFTLLRAWGDRQSGT